MTLVAWIGYLECLEPVPCVDHHIDYLKYSFAAINTEKQYANLQSSLITYHDPHKHEDVMAGFYEDVMADLYFASPTYAPTIPCSFGNATLEYKPEERRYYETGVKTEWKDPTACVTRLKFLVKHPHNPELHAGLSLSNDGYISTWEGVDNIRYLRAPPRLMPALLL